MAWPPPLISRPDWRAASTAAPRSTPRTERPEPLPTLAVHADHEGRPAVALDQAAGDDADHADVPALALDDQRRRQALAVGPVEALDAGDRLLEHLALDGAALGVELVEPDGERAHLVRIVARQQARAEIGLADAAAGIDPRAQHEAQMIGARRLAQARDIGERREAGIAALLHHRQPLPHQRAVDAGQRHDVGHRAERHEVEPLAQVGLGPRLAVPAGRAQRAVDADAQQEGDADGGELLVRARRRRSGWDRPPRAPRAARARPGDGRSPRRRARPCVASASGS